MASIDDFITMSLTIAGASPARQTFAVPLVAGNHTRFPELTRTRRAST